MIKNEKIKATEVQLTGLNGEDLGIMSTRDALALAKQYKVDLICMSLMSIIVRHIKTSVDSIQAFYVVIDCTRLN
jgi:hypothetical protein